MNKRPSLYLPNSPSWGASQIAVAYLLVGGLWILFSDQLAARIALNQQMLTIISLYKGWGYVLITALLLYLLIQRHTAKLRANEVQLHRILNTLPALISYVDKDRHYQFTNRAYQDWFEGPVVGKHVQEVIGAPAYQSVSQYIDRVLSGETVRYETEISLPDGERFVQGLFVPDLQADGTVKGYFALIHDLTEQKKAREELQLWADAFEGCYHGIAVGDPHTNRIIVCNPAFASLHKTRAEEIVGSAILSLYASSDHEHVRRNVQRADQIGHARFEANMIRKDGSTFPVQMDIVSVLGEDGELLHRVTTAQDISERKQAEENLRKNEERYRSLFENNPHPMWTYNRKTLAFLDVNEAAIQKYGYSRAEFLRMTIADIRPVEDMERLREHLSQARPALQHSGGWRHRLKDGTVIDVEITSHLIEIEGYEAALVVAQDVTERKRAEEKLRESEAKYRTLVEHLPAITYISKRDEFIGVSYISPQIKSYGFDLNTWLADPDLWFKHIHPDDQDRVTAALQQFKAGAETFKAEYRLLLPNGEARWFHDESIRVKDQSGKTLLKQGFMLDITEMKQAEQVIYESEERYRVVSELTSDYAYKDRVETDGSIVPEWFTDSFTRITGYSLEETHAPDFWQRLVHPDHLQLLLEHIQIILSGQPDTKEFRIITKSGQVRWLRDYANPVWDAEQNRIVSLYGAVQDVTEQKQSEEESKSLARFPEENPNPVMRATYEGKVVYANAASDSVLKDWGTKVGDYLPEDWIALIKELTKTRSEKIIEAECGEITYSFLLAYSPNANDVNIYGRDITEGRQAEEYLRRFELLSEHSRDIILFMSREDGRILEANAAAVRAYGYSREELLSLTVRDLRTSDTLGLTAEQMDQADTRGILFETIHRRKDGTTFPVEVSSQGANIGSVRTLISIVRDITERKQAEDALRLKDQLLHLTSEMAKVGGWEFDPETGKGTWTDEVARIHDIDPTQETNVEIGLSFYVDESRNKIEQAVKEAVELGKPYDLELEMVSAKGNRKWVRTMALPVMHNGKVIKVQGIFQDITERKQIEKALQVAHDGLELKVQERTAALSEANALLKALMDNMPDHIYFKDLQSRFIRTSKSQATLLGLNDPAEAIGKTDFDFFPHAARSYTEEQEVMKSGKPLIDLEEWVVWPDGRETWVSTTKMPLRNAERQTIGIFGISHDITERKRAEQEIKQLNADLERQAEKLQAANKELEAFSYSVSHDLRAPLRAIDGYTRILIEDYESILDAEGKRLCGIISREARRMGQLIDDLLAFSRLGRKEMYTSKIDMRGIAVSVLNELLKEEERARLDFQIGKLPPALGDSALIRQVWFNLLANAIKFTSKKERAVIEIGSKTSKDELIYYVRDTGAGFDMEYANKLFGVFQRLHSESEFDGTGVGLAIIQRIIHRHEGRVWAEGDVGKGATFYFALPRKEDHHE